MEEEKTVQGFTVTIQCPYDGHSLQYEVTPERLTAVPEVVVGDVYCAKCGKNVTDALYAAVNAPIILAGMALRPSRYPLSNRPVFRTMVEAMERIRALAQSAEYLTDRERSRLQAYFGIGGGYPKPYADIAEEQGVHPQTVHESVQKALLKIGYHDPEPLVRLFNPQASDASVDILRQMYAEFLSQADPGSIPLGDLPISSEVRQTLVVNGVFSLADLMEHQATLTEYGLSKEQAEEVRGVMESVASGEGVKIPA